MNGKIYIQDKPFEEIIRSAYESSRVECMGNLFGVRKNGFIWNVEQVHPIQIADRFPTSISTYDTFRGEWSFLNNHIGFFHSHVTSRESYDGVRLTLQPRANFSAEDIKDITLFPGKLELVIAIKRVKNRRRANQNPRFISGYIEDKNRLYRFDIGACYNNSGFRRAELEISDKMRRLVS